MWNLIVGVLPANMVIFCTVLAFVIPYGIYKINVKLHDMGDPPWKKEDEK